MDFLMKIHVVLRQELFATNITRERLYSGVRQKMSLQSPLAGAPNLAHGTLQRPQIDVVAGQVLLEFVLWSETFVALRTEEEFAFFDVDVAVLLELLEVIAGFVADLADGVVSVRIVDGIHVLAELEVGLEVLSADDA